MVILRLLSHFVETLKKAFITAPVLAQWEPGDPLIVETEASDYTLGAILSTITLSDNQVHPVKR